MYKVKCNTPGENVLAQNILFKRGYNWGFKRQSLVSPKQGMFIFIRPEAKRLTNVALNGQDYFEEHDFQEVTLSELLHV